MNQVSMKKLCLMVQKANVMMRLRLENALNLKKSQYSFPPPILSLAPGLARVQVNLQVDPVLHGWAKALSLINYLLDLPKIVKYKYHLVLDQDFQTCGVREHKRDPTVHEEDTEKALVK